MDVIVRIKNVNAANLCTNEQTCIPFLDFHHFFQPPNLGARILSLARSSHVLDCKSLLRGCSAMPFLVGVLCIIQLHVREHGCSRNFCLLCIWTVGCCWDLSLSQASSGLSCAGGFRTASPELGEHICCFLLLVWDLLLLESTSSQHLSFLFSQMESQRLWERK